MLKEKKWFLFCVYTCKPSAKTFGTIRLQRMQNIRDFEKADNFNDLNDKNFACLSYNRVLYFKVEAHSAKEAIAIVQEHNPGINQVRALEGISNQLHPKARYWSYATD